MLPFESLIATCKQANQSIIKANWSALARVQRKLKISPYSPGLYIGRTW